VVEFNGPGNNGSEVRDGVAYRIKAGDVVVIPAGTGHWFTGIEDHIDFLMVRIDPDSVTPLKSEAQSLDYLVEAGQARRVNRERCFDGCEAGSGPFAEISPLHFRDQPVTGDAADMPKSTGMTTTDMRADLTLTCAILGSPANFQLYVGYRTWHHR
jgi:hypothetical protein